VNRERDANKHSDIPLPFFAAAALSHARIDGHVRRYARSAKRIDDVCTRELAALSRVTFSGVLRQNRKSGLPVRSL